MNTHKIIFKTIVGSQAYGTHTPNSDIDYKGVYAQTVDELIGFGYTEQFEVSKDECYYEVRRFLQLLESANPTMLELLYMPTECIAEKHPAFDLIIENRDKFLTKKCLNSFGGYALAQVTKAKGLNKKMNWEKEKVMRKTPFDFCYIFQNDKTKSLNSFLTENNFDPKKCGLVNLNHFKDCYALYYDFDGNLNFNGIISESGNTVKLSSIPKNLDSIAILSFNSEGYSSHCKDFLEYQTWLANRNTERYSDIKNHNQKIDGKNLMHCRRLIEMAQEIAIHSTISVRRKNAMELLKIRKGEIDLNMFLEQIELEIEELKALFIKSSLPESVDPKFVNDLLLEVRRKLM